MKRYMFKRFLRSLFSIFMVLTIVFTLIYSVIPRDRVFFSDSNIEKIQKRPDDYEVPTAKKTNREDIE